MSGRESGADQVRATDVVDAFGAAVGSAYDAEWGSQVVAALELLCRERIAGRNLGYLEVLHDLARVRSRRLDPLAGWMEGAPVKPVMDALDPFRAQLTLLDTMNQKVTAEAMDKLAWVFLDACEPPLVWEDLTSRGAVRERPEPPDWDLMR